jgi:hypothetical protein
MALTDNLNVYYKLDESSGNAADSSGNSQTLTNNNTITYNAGLINNGATFVRASSQYFSANDNDLFTPLSSFSFQFWLKMDTTTNGEYFLFSMDTAGSRGNSCDHELGQPTATQANFQYSLKWSDGTENGCQFNLASKLSTSTWEHIVFVYDRTAHTMDCYRNGTAQTQVTGLPDKDNKNGTNSFNLGRSQYGTPDRYWSGMMDEVALWSRALSSTEVTALYNGGAGFQYPFGGGTVATHFFTLLGVGS